MTQCPTLSICRWYDFQGNGTISGGETCTAHSFIFLWVILVPGRGQDMSTLGGDANTLRLDLLPGAGSDVGWRGPRRHWAQGLGRFWDSTVGFGGMCDPLR